MFRRLIATSATWITIPLRLGLGIVMFIGLTSSLPAASNIRSRSLLLHSPFWFQAAARLQLIWRFPGEDNSFPISDCQLPI